MKAKMALLGQQQETELKKTFVHDAVVGSRQIRERNLCCNSSASSLQRRESI